MTNTLRARAATAVETLTPGYFALVMATGILSVGTELTGHHWLSVVLLWICITAFTVLLALTVVRLLRYRQAIVSDFLDPGRAFGFFTYVAGTNVLGTRLAGAGYDHVSVVFLGITMSAWLIFGYVIPWTAVLGKNERPVIKYANGTWFIWVVASQSVAVLSATVQPMYPRWDHELAVIAVFAWSLGVFLYVATGVFVALRLMLLELKPVELNPPYWVSMGALAITVLAGARIVEMNSAPMVDATRGLVAGLSVLFWAFATWLIPVLFVVGYWRHKIHKVPLKYEPTLWSMIFPLGMYAVAGIYLGRANHLPIVEWIGSTELWLALTAWTIVLVSMLRHLFKTVVSSSHHHTVAG